MRVGVRGRVIFLFWNRTLSFETPAVTAIAAGSSCTSNEVSMTWEDAPTLRPPARFNSRQPVFEWFLVFPPSLHGQTPTRQKPNSPKPFSIPVLVIQYKHADAQSSERCESRRSSRVVGASIAGATGLLPRLPRRPSPSSCSLRTPRSVAFPPCSSSRCDREGPRGQPRAKRPLPYS